jgi:hypothetical protein
MGEAGNLWSADDPKQPPLPSQVSPGPAAGNPESSLKVPLQLPSPGLGLEGGVAKPSPV